MKLSDKDYVNYIWHFKVEDDMPWSFCAGILNQNLHTKISAQTLEKKFLYYFKETTNIEPYTECPNCKGKLLPRKSPYGYFIGCSNFPNCRFMATSTKPYTEP